jgi:uncharacterized protein YjdB
MKNLSLAILALILPFVSFALGPITGASSVCVGSYATLSDATTGGTWSSSNVGIATAGSAMSYNLYGVSPGTATITYTAGGVFVTTVITVNAGPAPITGSLTVCPGASSALSDVTPGGMWSSHDVSSVTVGSTSGIITGITAEGGVGIVYTLPDGCNTTQSVTVTSISPITGPSTVCLGGTMTLSDGSGVWSSSNIAVGTIGVSGIVGGVSLGTTTVSFASGGCSVEHVVTVISTPAPVTGATTICNYPYPYATLSDATGGGAWSSAGPGVATIDGSGDLYPVSAGTATIIYTTACGSAETVLTVIPAPATIVAPATICMGGSATLTDATSGGAWGASLSGATFDTATRLLTGVSMSGGGVVSYTLPDGCFSTSTVTVMSSISPITGPLTVCPGGSITLSDATAGGTWASATGAVATIGATTGVVAGIAAGTSAVTYATGGGCAAYATVLVSPGLAAITGAASVCIGHTSALADATGGGAWSSSTITIATVGLSTGIVTGVAPGTATISYATSCGTVTTIVTVNAAPAPISGTLTLCAGSTETLTDATSGGIWRGSGGAGVTFDTATALVTGVTPSSELHVTYTASDGCISSLTVTITGTSPIGAITGLLSVCSGSTITLADGTPGGAWSSSNPVIATVSGGVVSGVSAGAVNIIYSVTESCGIVTASETVTVVGATSAGSILGASSVAVAGASVLSETVAGGTWSSSNTAVAAIGSSGIVTGISTGTATISYAVAGCSGTVYATQVITVSPIDGISGYVVFTGPYYGPVKVWLISYNPGTLILSAVDSTTVTSGGDSVYYQFTGLSADSFRVKAAVATFVGTGYIPTYHTSSFYWHDASVVYHTAGTADILQDIEMATGTSAGGPGFIAGNVTMGANRGTSAGIAAAGLLLYAINPATGAVIQQAYTDGSGNYAFSNLPTGNYTIYPEAINYNTTPLLVTLTSANDSVQTANFIEHTISFTITPGTTGVTAVSPAVSSVIAFPNPTNGRLNIQWQEPANESGSVTISDITGREMYKTTINMTQGTGVSQINVSGLANGLYMISIRSEDINYNSKIEVQR